MADQPQQPAQQQMQIRVDESKMNTAYANTIRSTTSLDEMVLDFGLNLAMQTAQGQPPTLVFYVGSRVILNWAGAKRLMQSLQQAISGYEQQFGEIKLDQPRAQHRPAT